MKRPAVGRRPLLKAVRREPALQRQNPTLGACPACGRSVHPDGHAIRLRGYFFHVECALYRRDRVA